MAQRLPAVIPQSKDQKAKSRQHSFAAEISIFGRNPTDDIGCALGNRPRHLYIANRNAIVAIYPWSDLKTIIVLPRRGSRGFRRSIANLTDSRHGIAHGQVRLWLNKGNCLAELSTDGALWARLIYPYGKTLIDGRYAWDVSDLAAEIGTNPRQQ